MLDIALAVCLLAMVVYAVYRRPDWVAGCLLVLFCIGAVMHMTQPAGRLPGMLGGLDALVSITMLLVWTYYRSQRARIVGTVSLLKCALAFLMSTNGLEWVLYAAALNAAFVFQVIVAGGLADGLVVWLDRIDPSSIRERVRRRDKLG